MLPDELLRQLADETRRIANLGFMACTAGNSSVLLSQDPFIIAMSPSGIDKTTLTYGAFLRVGPDARTIPPDTRKPSDETALHVALYHSTGCGAVSHGHPAHAVALSMAAGEALEFTGIEMQKAFAGTTTHECVRRIPIIDNHQDMAVLADRTLAARDPHVPAVLVRGHGVYAWGRHPAEAARHLEAVEWLCRLRCIALGAGLTQV